MNFALIGRSGHLYKASGLSWADCLGQTPVAVTSGDIRAGASYWIEKTIQHWAIWRPFLAFDTSLLGQKKKSVLAASLVLPITRNRSESEWVLEAWAMSGDGWGDTLDPGDWNAPKGTLIDQTRAQDKGAGGTLTFDVSPELINRTGITYFQLNCNDDENTLNPPTDKRDIDFGRGAILVVDTGNVNDDVCQNIADVLEAKDYTILDGVTIRPRLLPVLKAIPEIQIAWEGTETDLTSGDQIISASLYYIQSALSGPAASEPSSIDEGPRKMLDSLRRILISDGNCNGYCSNLIDVTEVLAGDLQWRDNWYQGGVLTVRYKRTVGSGKWDPSLEPYG